MDGSRNRGPAPRPFERSSLFGLVSFRPRTAIVLAALTLTVGIVAFHFLRESELRRTDVLVQEGMRLFAAAPQGASPDGTADPSEAEAQVQAITGARILLPRDERLFSYRGVAQGRVGKGPAAAVRLAYEGDPFVLLVVRRHALAHGEAPDAVAPDVDFVSGERGGDSFVFWERDGTVYCLVSSVDLTRAFDLVRRYF